ncbi:MAG TPA: hypothetical protein VH639_27380 [Bryobacteraceae bacterium]|jgi:hypothetical protein
MERRALGILAIVLIGLMALVATAGLDNLPGSVKKSVEAGNSLLLKDKQALEQDKSAIEQAIAEDPGLFQKEADDWKSRLSQDGAQLDAAAAKLAAVQQIVKANRRSDEANVERGLTEFNSLRQQALQDASAAQAEAQRRLAFKRALPDRLKAMQASYDSLQFLDSDSSDAAVRKAMTDWPAKREDLQTRLDALKGLKTQAQSVWDSSAELRSAAAKGNLPDSSLETLSSDADQIDALGSRAKEGIAADTALAGQLYTSWDKLLLDVEKDNSPREKVRIVRTRFPDASLANGQTTSEERWEPLDISLTRRSEDPTGMVIERKPAGKYDSEAEHTVQTPGYAYIAPPGQSNAYGSWSGGVWHWLPEYLLLSHLLRSSQPTITLPDYDAYRYARSRGETYYGRDRQPQATRPYSSDGGGWYSERSRPSSGGFGSSGYRSQGTFSSSQYRSRGSFGSGSFGGGGGFRSRGFGSSGGFRGGRR